MNISKKVLKQIIQEELGKILGEIINESELITVEEQLPKSPIKKMIISEEQLEKITLKILKEMEI